LWYFAVRLSLLAEFHHRLIFLKSKTGKELVLAVESWIYREDPGHFRAGFSPFLSDPPPGFALIAGHDHVYAHNQNPDVLSVIFCVLEVLID
jgi:hypothetical protein